MSDELSTDPVDTAPQAVTVGNTKLIADARANSIIVLGTTDVVVKVEKILDEMDVKAPQVALSTVIGELSLSDGEEFGVDYFARYKGKVVGTSGNNRRPRFPSRFLWAWVAPGGILDPSGLINFGQILQSVGTGTNVYIAAGNYLSAIVHALDSTGRFKTISRPTVFTSNNKKAIIASGQEIPVPTNTISGSTGSIITRHFAADEYRVQEDRAATRGRAADQCEKEVSLDILQKLDSLPDSRPGWTGTDSDAQRATSAQPSPRLTGSRLFWAVSSRTRSGTTDPESRSWIGSRWSARYSGAQTRRRTALNSSS